MTNLTPRARLLLVGLAAMLILGAYSIWWYRLAAAWQAGLAGWVAESHAHGLAITTGEVTVGGFPGSLRLVLARPSVTYPALFAWQGPPLTAIISPLAPNRPRLIVPGEHRLAFGSHPPLTVTAANASADLVLNANGLDHAAFDLGAMAANGGQLGRLAGSLRRLAPDPAPPGVPSFALSANLQQLDLPADPRLLLGHRLESARIEARLLGSLPAGPPRTAVAGWRDDGGTVEVDALAVNWPPLGVTGKGTLVTVTLLAAEATVLLES